MNDPYVVLGVSPDASDDEIKRIYRELARKYHPDNYHDNPLADLASDKMKEINEAYDEINRQRAQGGYRSNSGRGASSEPGGSARAYRPYTGADAASFGEIRSHINAGHLDRAEQLLNSIQNRNAEWNFLMGSVAYRKGWLDEADSYFHNAAAMEPSNAEYRQAVQYMNRGGKAYRPSNGTRANGDQACDCCAKLYCADCCCECMGGDLISCC